MSLDSVVFCAFLTALHRRLDPLGEEGRALTARVRQGGRCRGRQNLERRPHSDACWTGACEVIILRLTDRGYESAARIDPYYAVIPFPRFRLSELNEETRREFFDSGQQHVDDVLSVIRAVFDPTFKPNRVLDYGCGTGRLLIPLARFAQHAVGIDISPSMLEETKRNCERFGIHNSELLLADDRLTRLKGTFNLVHSAIVFQHIPQNRVLQIVRTLLHHVEPGGFGSLHFLLWSPKSLRVARFVRRSLPLGNSIANLLKGRPWNFGYIGLYPSSLDLVVALLSEARIRDVFIRFDDQSDISVDRRAQVTFRMPK